MDKEKSRIMYTSCIMYHVMDRNPKKKSQLERRQWRKNKRKDYFNMDKRCSIFTAEMVAVAKAIQKNEKRETDLLILTDSLSAIQDLKDNRISVYKKDYMLEARSKYKQPRGKLTTRRQQLPKLVKKSIRYIRKKYIQKAENNTYII